MDIKHKIIEQLFLKTMSNIINKSNEFLNINQSEMFVLFINSAMNKLLENINQNHTLEINKLNKKYENCNSELLSKKNELDFKNEEIKDLKERLSKFEILIEEKPKI
jgi:hypothetical protein